MFIVIMLDLELFHIDVKTTFLNDKLKEEIFIQQSKVAKLKVKKVRYASLKNLYMVLSNLQENVTILSLMLLLNVVL